VSTDARARRARAHAAALRVEDPDERWTRAYAENVTTSEEAGNAMAEKFGGAYAVALTLAYWAAATEAPQLPDEEVDAAALGYATQAAAFGTVEYARQDVRPWLKTWHHTPSDNPRPEHEDLDGMTVGLDEDFGDWHEPGGLGCQCWIELVPPED
jgi:hypothetical protein